MDDIKSVLMTKDVLDKLRKDHEDLVKVKLPESVDRVARARDFGDLTENAEYSAARDELSFTEGRIQELEEILKNVQLVKTSKVSHSKIDIGCTVTVDISGQKDTFTVVGDWEADPATKKISHSSPLGKALLGKKAGEKVEVEAPVGKLTYTILKVD